MKITTPGKGLPSQLFSNSFFEAQNLCSKAILHEYANKYSKYKSLLWLRKGVGDPQESPSSKSPPPHPNNGSWKGATGSQGTSKAKFKNTRSYPKRCFFSPFCKTFLRILFKLTHSGKYPNTIS